MTRPALPNDVYTMYVMELKYLPPIDWVTPIIRIKSSTTVLFELTGLPKTNTIGQWSYLARMTS